MGFRPRVQLSAAVDRDFERTALPYFQFVFPDIVQPTARAAWDRKGVDLMTSPERNPIRACVQCKTTLKPKFEPSDVDGFLAELEKFRGAKISCERYILALNRNDFGGTIQSAVSKYCAQTDGLPNVEVWDVARIVDEAQNIVVQLIRDRIKQFNLEWSEQLIGRFAPSGGWIRHIPCRRFRMMLDWEHEPELRENIVAGEIDIKARLLNPRNPLMGLLIGDDGIGKTSAALMTSQAAEQTVIYVPAAVLKADEEGTSVLTREIGRAIDVQQPKDSSNKLFLFFLGRGLAKILRQDSSVIVIIDGLDENRKFRGFQGLKLIRAYFKGMRCRVIISTRTKHFNLRTGDFAQALENKGKTGNRRKGIQVIELLPWTLQTAVKHVEDILKTLAPKQQVRLSELIDAIKTGKAQPLYGSLLTHPIYLDLIVDDVLNDKIQQSTKSALVRSWILRKIKRDQSKYQGAPLGGDVISESRLIFTALEEIALAMSEPSSFIPLESINHTRVAEILSRHHLSADEIFELLLKSVLVTVGHSTTFSESKVIFSHRVFQEYLIASALVEKKIKHPDNTPSEITSFAKEIAAFRQNAVS